MKLFIRYSLLIVVLFMFPSIAEAQILASETDFSGLKSGSNTPVPLGTTHSDYPGWEFNKCYKVSGGGLFVGEGDSSGSFTSASLNIEGNANIILEVKRSSSGNATIEASVTGGGTLLSAATKTIDNSTYYHVVYKVKDGASSTRLTITGISGKFYVKNMRVYNIDDAIFYESFDNVNGRGGNDETFMPSSSDDPVSPTRFDNSTNSETSGIMPGYKCIYLNMKSTHYYRTPGMNFVPNGKTVLSFRIAENRADNTEHLVIKSFLNSSSEGTIVDIPNFGDFEIDKWKYYYVNIEDLTENTFFEFRSSFCFIDEIKVSVVPSNLDEAKDNMIYITANAAQTRDVQLIRTLTPNIWCPLCLPFDVTKELMEETTGTTCELCTLSSIDDGVFKFEIATSTIAAGTPFLVRVNETVTNPEFKDVTIVNTPSATATASTDDYKFVGTYSPVDLETNGTNLFLATDGELYIPASTSGDNRLAGLRAYFVVPPTANTARVMIPETTSNISSLREESPSSSHELYDLRGQRVNNPNHKGIYIHKGKRFLVP